MTDRFTSNLVARAKALRKHATPQENHLWYDFLKSYPVKFRRQTIIQSYIVDFYCPAVKLAVEIDGSQHYAPEGIAYDAARTAVIEQFGIKVIRFSNHDINSSFSSVCDTIDREVRERLC